MGTDHTKRFDVAIELFGSQRTGSARLDSDYDVLLMHDQFAQHIVPQPLPHDQPNFYQPSFGVENHHSEKYRWSLRLWEQLGGEKALAQFRRLAAQKLQENYEAISPDGVDLFLHIPTSVSPTVYAVRLTWMDNNARLDFACASFQNHCGHIPECQQRFQTIGTSGKPPALMAADLEIALQDLTGIERDETYRNYPSLPEQRRHEADYQKTVALLGPL